MDGLTHLPEDRRDALIMRFALWNGQPRDRAGARRTDGATKVLIHRATVKQLEEEIEEDEEHDGG